MKINCSKWMLLTQKTLKAYYAIHVYISLGRQSEANKGICNSRILERDLYSGNWISVLEKVVHSAGWY